MQKPEPPVIQPFTFVFSWRRFSLHCAIMGVCVFLGMMTWYFGKPHSVRFYETKSEAPLAAAIASDIDMALDMRSFVAVKESQPVQVELFKGSVYFDIKKNATNQLEVKVGNAIIKNTGTRFSIQMQKDGNSHIAVADGHIKIQVASGTYQINALEQAEFDDVRISKHSLITEHDIAPWRSDP
ncbi:MAG: FecR family protein [Nitrosomonas sp.]|uniref:FecR family protein n=1 Tax=Nitrosomonas sp. TaxID=42353 RepID=UPI00273409A6|nr:FecR family protein [Nitrosomonas sp.]MDP3279478.1 FecR family protein [Nitrosomonas sp.]MDP3664296.1 FecR family protein [Nitrosomonas sp.]MDZ4107443.1 FecR family protein [Nitrosomonas sp.]